MASKSMDEALEDVGRVLVYDPTTRQLCLRPRTPVRKNSDTDSGFSGTSSKDISVSSLSSHDVPDEDDIPDLDFSPAMPERSRESRSRKLISNIIHKLTPSSQHQSASDDTHNNLSKENSVTLSLSPEYNSSSSPLHLSLQQRPPNLPPKSSEEEAKHKCQFEAIVKSSKKRQAKSLQQKLESEDKVSSSISVWNTEILPAWPECLAWKRTRELWSQGVPGPVRCRLWQLAIGNELNITKELYDISLTRSRITVWSECDPKELTSMLASLSLSNSLTDSDAHLPSSHSSAKESTAFQIKLDVSRTFSHLGLFQESGPYHDTLVNILAAYSVCRPDLGYSQGMSFLAAMLLLNLDSPESVFIAFCNLINRHPFQAFYRLSRDQMQKVYDSFSGHLSKLHPKLMAHFTEIQLKPEFFLVEQIYTLFSRSLPLDCACRIWDLYLLEGEPLLYRASLALLSLHHDLILEMDFAETAKLLTNPMMINYTFDTAKYFRCLADIKL